MLTLPDGEQLHNDLQHDPSHIHELSRRIADRDVPLLQPDQLHRNLLSGGEILMKTLRISILFALFSSALFAQDVAPPVSLGGPAGVTGGLSLEGQNILTHMTDANYTMIAGGWWAATQIIPSTLTQTSAHTITAPANGGSLISSAISRAAASLTPLPPGAGEPYPSQMVAASVCIT